MNKLTRLICTAVAAIYLSGCTTLRVVETADPRVQKPGEDVIVTTRDGKRHEMQLVSATGQEVCDRQRCIAAAQIAKIEVRELDGWKTVGLVVLVALAVGVAALAAGGGGGMWGPPVLP